MAEKITDATVSLCTESRYVKAYRMHYKQDGVQKTWDYIHGHDSVAILLYNKEREVFHCVKQFRPAVYASKIKAFGDGHVVDTSKHQGNIGMTLELCAGIVDKDKDLTELAQGEVLEETGYKVPLENIQKITSFRNALGTEGTEQTLFYAEVSDSMKVSSGGGLAEEGEYIEVVDLPRKGALQFVMDESINKPAGMMFGLTWFFLMKDKADNSG